jgi:hypothetical protein
MIAVVSVKTVVEKRNRREENIMVSRSVYTFVVAALAVFVSPASGTAAESRCPVILDHKFANLMDEPVSLCAFRGKVLLVVNTASECGTRRSTTAWKSYIAVIGTKGSLSWAFQRTISAARSRGQTNKSSNSAG